MDVRCEKCQTEYELDEARLKPSGVTVKCTNCGHMFKIRKRSNTNVGAPVVPPQPERSRPVSSKQPLARAGSLDDDPTLQTDAAPDRQWLIRLETGEQKSCRELAMLQQWIVAGVVTRNSLISRSGKTWKSLGDISELRQYFLIADEAKATREQKPTKPPPVATMMGIGAAATKAAGSDDDELEGRTTGSFKAQDTVAATPPKRRGITQPPPPPKSTKTPPMGSGASTAPPPVPAKVDAMAKTMAPVAVPTAQAKPRPITQPPPVPAKAPEGNRTWAELPATPAKPAPEPGGRATAVWATEGGKKVGTAAADAETAEQARPFSGKISAIPDEPAFAAGRGPGRVRVEPADESSFQTGKVRMLEDDDAVLPRRSGSKAGIVFAVIALLVVGAGAAAVWWFVIRKPDANVAAVADAGSGSDVVAVIGDGGTTAEAIVDAGSAAATASPVEVARAELDGDLEPRLREAMKSLDGNQAPEAQAMRAHLAARLAQNLQDRAGLLTDKTEAEKLRKEAKTILIDAATLAQLAQKAKPEAALGNLAMAEILRLNGKRAADIKRYAETARKDPAWTREVLLADALVLHRDGKLDDAKAILEKLDTDARDVRPKFHRAMIAFATNKPDDAKVQVDEILAVQPEHAAARALGDRLATLVTKTDPLPPEDGTKPPKDAGVPVVASGSGSGSGSGSAKSPPDPVPTGGGSYDSYMREANKVADSNCGKAIELYGKALEVKPDSAEAHTGIGYCFVDQKKWGEAQSKFRTALRFAPKYEPAMYGIAESYQYQGRKDDAIEAYKAYLAAFPGTQKAIKQLERLGVTDAGGGTPTPTPPTPTPTPTPEAGSGSGTE